MRVFIAIFVLLSLVSCTTKNWADRYKYVAPRGWSKEEYVRSKLPKPPQREESEEKESMLEKEKKELLSRLVKKPPVPVKLPDRILRILILPWVDKEGNLHTHRYVFVKVEEGKWILGNYLLEEEDITKEIKPLEEVLDGS